MYFSVVWVYLLTLPVQLQRKWSMSAPYAAHFYTIRNGTMTRRMPPMWMNVVRPCWQNCGHGASNSPTSTRQMRLVTFSAPCPPRYRARATESLCESVCVEVQDRVWALMRGAGRDEHPTVRWSSGPISVVEANSDTTYVFPKKGTGGTLAIAFMNSTLKPFLRSLVGGQGLRDDAMDYIRQNMPLRPPVSCREARAAVEVVGFIPLAMQHIAPSMPNAMFIDHVHAPP